MKISAELATILEDFERRKVWGQVQLDFVQGQLSVIRKQETTKFQPTGENQRGTASSIRK